MATLSTNRCLTYSAVHIMQGMSAAGRSTQRAYCNEAVEQALPALLIILIRRNANTRAMQDTTRKPTAIGVMKSLRIRSAGFRSSLSVSSTASAAVLSFSALKTSESVNIQDLAILRSFSDHPT